VSDASTQHYLNIADIQSDTLVLKNGELRQIVEITALNFALKSEAEQSAIIYQYQAFLNSLQFPVQILVQSRRLDLSTYVSDLQARIAQTNSQLMKIQIADYIDFISRLITLGSIMEKHFYVVVPYSATAQTGKNMLTRIFKRDGTQLTPKEMNDGRAKIADRVNIIRSGLGSIGLTSRVLTNDEIIRVLYSTYNPIEADEITPKPNEQVKTNA
jgi:hypothetical protein